MADITPNDEAFKAFKAVNPNASDKDIVQAILDARAGKMMENTQPGDEKPAIFSSPQGFKGPGILSHVASRITGINPQSIYDATTPILEGTAATLAGGQIAPMIAAGRFAPHVGRVIGSAAEGAYNAPQGEKVDAALKNAATATGAEAAFPLVASQVRRLLGMGKNVTMPSATRETTRYNNQAGMPQLYSGANPQLQQPNPTLYNAQGSPIFTPSTPPGMQNVAENVTTRVPITPTVSQRNFGQVAPALQAAVDATANQPPGDLAKIIGLKKLMDMFNGVMGEGQRTPIYFQGNR